MVEQSTSPLYPIFMQMFITVFIYFSQFYVQDFMLAFLYITLEADVLQNSLSSFSLIFNSTFVSFFFHFYFAEKKINLTKAEVVCFVLNHRGTFEPKTVLSAFMYFILIISVILKARNLTRICLLLWFFKYFDPFVAGYIEKIWILPTLFTLWTILGPLTPIMTTREGERELLHK